MTSVLAISVFGWNLSYEVAVIGAITGLTYAVLGAGLVLLYRATGILNFAHGEVGTLARPRSSGGSCCRKAGTTGSRS